MSPLRQERSQLQTATAKLATSERTRAACRVLWRRFASWGRGRELVLRAHLDGARFSTPPIAPVCVSCVLLARSFPKQVLAQNVQRTPAAQLQVMLVNAMPDTLSMGMAACRAPTAFSRQREAIMRALHVLLARKVAVAMTEF